MAKYINVDNLHFPNIATFNMKLHGVAVPMVRLIDLKELVPSADVAEVVRCKDCRFHTTDPECFDEFEITDKPMMCVGIRYGGVDPDWFCEHGERMDGKQ